MSTLFRWDKGRQGSGYYKMLLCASKFLKFDIYLLKFPKGSHVDWHTDPVPAGYKHFRLNLFLNKGSYEGGDFKAKWPRLRSSEHMELFRPDTNPHCVTMITKGTRYVLSIGWLRKK